MQPSHPPESANNGKTIWVFTPSRTDPKDLEFILVQRQNLLKDAVERVRESALTDHKHHLLFVGPRGCGKTHLVTLIVNRLAEDETLTDRLRIAWLNEDETCTTLLEFLLKIHAALEKRYPKEYNEDMLSAAYDLKQDAALEFVSKHLLSTLGSRTLLVVTENLDAIFEGLGDSGQKKLRSFIQENPRLSIVATAQRLVEDLSNRNSPFFGFFQTEHLKPLTVEQATELLQNIARLQEKTEVVEFLSTSRGRSRVRAIHHLSGGNHRIYIVLSQFITRDSVDALLEPFMKMVDELTPYYQERIRWLPPMQRKIVEYLCICEGTVPVKEIAKRLFATPQTISSQLQDLREKGYVAANQRGRESLYEVSEPLMRICVEVKDNQRLQPLRLLVDFLRVWYDDQDLKHRLGKTVAASKACGYLESAIQRNVVEGNLRKNILLEDLHSGLSCNVSPAERKRLMVDLGMLPEPATLAMQLWAEGNAGAALECFNEALNEIADQPAKIQLAQETALALLNRGVAHGHAGETERALTDFAAVIHLPHAPVEQVADAFYNRGFAHSQIDDPQRAADDYTKVINLPGAPVNLVATALFNRAITHSQTGNVQMEINDYTAIIDLPGALVEQVAKALINRGSAYGLSGHTLLEIIDYTTVTNLSEAPVGQVIMALVNRGITHSQMGNLQLAITDFTAVINQPEATVEQVSQALIGRSITHGQLGDMQPSINDCTAVVGRPDAPTEIRAAALVYRGIKYGQVGNTQLAIKDFTSVIDLPKVPVEHFALALILRGVTYDQAGDAQLAINDFTAVINLTGAPVKQVALALFNRGVIRGKAGDTQLALDDYTALVALPGAPVEQVATALNNSGAIHLKKGDKHKSQSDYERLLNLPDVISPARVEAYLGLSEIHFSEGQWNEGFLKLEASLECGAKHQPAYSGKATDLIEVIFSAGLNPEGRCDKVTELLQLYQKYQALPVLGEAVIQHIGRIYRSGEPFPSLDNLEGWKSAWEQASENVPDFRLSIRLLSTSISFLKAGGKDRTILLDLASAERSIVEQALGMAEEPN